MRANGEPERFATGNAEPYEKFLAWARTVPDTLRNPLYHWTHLELLRYFNITESLNSESAPRIWQQANELLASGALDVHQILARFNVNTIGTTDDPADSLEYHQRIAQSNLPTRVVPTFRPDNALRVNDPVAFDAWLAKLTQITDEPIDSLAKLLKALERRVEDFHTIGCRLSDHGLDICYAEPCTDAEAQTIFAKATNGYAASTEDHTRFASYILFHLGQLYAQHNWTMQLHLGALRNVNSRAKAIHGPDTGFDTMGGVSQLPALAKFLERLELANSLPKTIVYNSNPIENYPFATITGSFSAPDDPW